ncbi:MAG: C1 family peptidase, partial [Muribaculaceae bacterium]|nr:C1 family peptidase [Muribaculaceae bacterium]
MTPVLFLRKPGAADAVAEAAEHKLRRDGFGPDALRCLCFDPAREGISATGRMLAGQYTELIGLEATDTTMHVVLMLPLWQPDAAAVARTLVEAAGAISHRTSIDILALRGSLAAGDEKAAAAAAEHSERELIATVAQCAAEAAMACRIVLLANYNSSGAAAGFDDALLAGFVAELLRVFVENYADTFGRMEGRTASGKPAVVAAGLAGLEFDRDAMADYLLSRAFVSALDKAGITTAKVDAQSAARRAAACLDGIDRFYEEFYDSQVEPLVARGLPEGEIAARLREPLDRAVEALRSRLTSFLDDDSLSLPQKEAVWALVLGLDNRLLGGARYREHHLSFDDVMSQPIDLYVGAYNDLAAGENLLPQAGMYPALVPMLVDPASGRAMNPLPGIKALKTDMLDLTAFMRAKERELEALNAQNRDRAVAEGHLSEGGFVWRGVQRRLDAAVDEQPLQDSYTPPEGLKPLPSVDLRKYFRPVLDQGALGSCTSFAVAAMCEYIINRNSGEAPGIPLSRQFLFYHTNVAPGRADGGSSFHDQLDVASRLGVCAEELYPYTAQPSCPPPDPEAEADARNHRVVKALQIPLVQSGSKYEAMQANHTLITAALTEGYPVGVALRVFDDFADHPGGHVPRPADDAIEHSDHGRHAMVITGYSERDKCYIVRNSWGEGFGDNGYAYISFSYVDDPDLCLFACIVAETTDGTPHGTGTAVPQLMAPFGGTQTQINIAATRNALDDARLRLASLNETYNELYRYYADLMQHLSQPLVRNELRKRSEADVQMRIVELEVERRKLIDEMPGKLRDFKFHYIK